MAKTKKSIDTEVNDRFISFFSDRKISITEAAQEIGLTRETFYYYLMQENIEETSKLIRTQMELEQFQEDKLKIELLLENGEITGVFK
jgi:5-bromo-4-chloroindolyl phosphate hydrolysis protein